MNADTQKAYLESLEQRAAAEQLQINSWKQTVEQLAAERDALRAENARLKAILRAEQA